jgi:methionine-gamma-lyase
VRESAVQRIRDLYRASGLGPDRGLSHDPKASVAYELSDVAELERVFRGEQSGRHIYARQVCPATEELARALAAMEGAEAAHVFSSGMAAISAVILQLCDSGSAIVASSGVYGGTYAFFQNFLLRSDVRVRFANLEDLASVERKIGPRTVALYCER